MTHYENDHSRLLNRLAQQADTLAANAAAWADHLASARAEAARAEELFLSDFSPATAAALAEAKNRVTNVMHAANAVENAGGPAEARATALRAPVVYSTLAKGFAGRITALSKLVPLALKRLGERRAALTETGVNVGAIEADPVVAGLRAYHAALVRNLEVSTYGETFAKDRGVGRQPRTFNDLYGCLTGAFPQPPAA